jgi:hypothetical protein
MSDDLFTRYEALPLKDGGGWYIVVTPADHGATHEIHGFVSETEARDWIRKEMNAEARAKSVTPPSRVSSDGVRAFIPNWRSLD